MNIEILRECTLCPHDCKVDRFNGEIGRCRAGRNIKIALANLHYFEEPCISGKSGSGTVFFTGCNMNCIFCQNYKISQEHLGQEITIEELADKFIELQNKKANNINLVTGVMYIPQIIDVIKLAKNKGLTIPIIYNTSGYEKKETIELLKGYIDVYLPDLKYYYNDIAKKLSGIENYFENATDSIKEMYKQVGAPKYDGNGIIKSGVIIRHLILPSFIENSKMVLKWIKENMPEDIIVSVMAQYFPTYKAMSSKVINRKLTEDEYKEIEQFVFSLDLNGYIQDLEEDEEKYVPQFDKK